MKCNHLASLGLKGLIPIHFSRRYWRTFPLTNPNPNPGKLTDK